MAIALVDTIGRVATRTKRVPQSVLDAFARALSRWVSEKCEGNQTLASSILGISQGHISALMLGTRGPGLPTIILVREKTGLSADELLGFGPPDVDALVERLKSSLVTDVARMRSQATRTLEAARVETAKVTPDRPAQPKRRRRSG